jgi:hypothetical protein
MVVWRAEAEAKTRADLPLIKFVESEIKKRLKGL